ncbi:MAG: AAA family ATPase, partial [Desulfovibrio sp.]|nr:AAA family ATPase [Desulfovibrio sp.]
AAINAGGSTIHSLFHFPPRALAPDDEAIKIDNRRQKMFKTMETLVIDEISMVSADIMDAMDEFLRLNRGKDEPFGGVQVVMFGDPFQLPPVIKGKQLRDYFQNTYGGPYFFNARSFEEGRFSCLELSRVFRQKDEVFLRLLNAAREMTFTARDLRILNSRQRPEQAGDLSVSLCSTNALAQEINERELARLPGKAFEYEAIITGAFKPGDAPTDPLLVLKEGAQVMMVKNDPDKRWINGTLGVIRKLDDNGVTAAIDGMDYDIPRETWEIVDYEYDRDKNKISPKVAGRFTQYPLKLAWAITIHKSQGQTFDRVRVNLGSGAFAHGQTYVALSRCRTLEGLTLEKPVRASDIRIDPLVLEFASRVKSVIPKRG